MILVFKTNVVSPRDARLLHRRLSQRLSTHQINFDLEDYDKVLRIEHENNITNWVIQWLTGWGYVCEEL